MRPIVRLILFSYAFRIKIFRKPECLLLTAVTIVCSWARTHPFGFERL